MKVICIKSFIDCKKSPTLIGNPMMPEVGSTYTVIDHKVINGTHCYRLAECPDYGYNSRHFAPCSDIDETELVNEKELAV